MLITGHAQNFLVFACFLYSYVGWSGVISLQAVLVGLTLITNRYFIWTWFQCFFCKHFSISSFIYHPLGFPMHTPSIHICLSFITFSTILIFQLLSYSPFMHTLTVLISLFLLFSPCSHSCSHLPAFFFILHMQTSIIPVIHLFSSFSPQFPSPLVSSLFCAHFCSPCHSAIFFTLPLQSSLVLQISRVVNPCVVLALPISVISAHITPLPQSAKE